MHFVTRAIVFIPLSSRWRNAFRQHWPTLTKSGITPDEYGFLLSHHIHSLASLNCFLAFQLMILFRQIQQGPYCTWPIASPRVLLCYLACNVLSQPLCCAIPQYKSCHSFTSSAMGKSPHCWVIRKSVGQRDIRELRTKETHVRLTSVSLLHTIISVEGLGVCTNCVADRFTLFHKFPCWWQMRKVSILKVLRHLSGSMPYTFYYGKE